MASLFDHVKTSTSRVVYRCPFFYLINDFDNQAQLRGCDDAELNRLSKHASPWNDVASFTSCPNLNPTLPSFKSRVVYGYRSAMFIAKSEL